MSALLFGGGDILKEYSEFGQMGVNFILICVLNWAFPLRCPIFTDWLTLILVPAGRKEQMSLPDRKSL